jgi:hypothetical protein
VTTNLLGLRVENYKAVSLFEADFTPDGGVVALAGSNGAGKSSVIDALVSVLAGRKQPPVTQPVKAGAMEARVIATFDDLIAERVWKNGSTSIVLRNAEGRKYTDATALAKLYEHVALDPFAFSQMDPKAQVDMLLPMIGVDPAPFDKAHDDAYADRTEAGRVKDALQARLAAAPPVPEGTPDEEFSASQLLAELDRVTDENAAHAAAVAQVLSLNAAANRAEAAVDTAREAYEAARDVRAEAFASLGAAEADLHRLAPPSDVEPLRARVASVDAVNAAVRAKATRAALQADTTAAVAEHARLDAAVRKAKADKAAALAAAKMPVPKMTLDPDTMTLLLDGTPFADASSGVKVRTGFILAMVLNPDLKLVIIRDAALLDADNQRIIRKLADDNKFLVLMEVAGDAAGVDGAVIVITDGAISEVRA